MPLRRAPKVDRDVRVIEIEGFDMSPCGGTHCTRSGQIGLVRVVGLEKYKGGWRVTFHAGRRALDDARKKEAVLNELAREFTCGVFDVGSAVARLRARREGTDGRPGDDAGRAGRAPGRPRPRVAILPRPEARRRSSSCGNDDDVPMLRTLAGRLASRPDVVAFCASPDERAGGDWSIVVQRGTGTPFDCGAWLKAVTSEHGGRGGGRPERAEGRLPRVVSLEKLVAKGRQRLRRRLRLPPALACATL